MNIFAYTCPLSRSPVRLWFTLCRAPATYTQIHTPLRYLFTS
ncbi:unnamed protein product [Spirodela intermedia]|uniref:Uncharacterized protein n=2 Tax=Spirodela intermedia TaxID=51605 RepID=A0A7I8LEJ7_SPIIN|nr:unnamed protein product [Spirodela intermedia]CAA6670622.1 unnamed protein product [Spirodela intermedia]CAA7407704.1 unnamed protein product [Spirodela intermedia]